jgi:hypothetical protein
MALVAFSATRSHTDGKTGGTRQRSSSGRRQPPRSGDRFAALDREHSPASSGTVAIAEIVAHTACTKRPRGPALVSCQRPRPHWHRAGHIAGAPRRENPITTLFCGPRGPARRDHEDLVDRCRECRARGCEPRHDLHSRAVGTTSSSGRVGDSVPRSTMFCIGTCRENQKR